MTRLIATLLVSVMLILAPSRPAPSPKPIAKTALQAAGLLYASKDTEKHYLCSTFTFEHDGNKYEIGTASHCVSDPDLPEGLKFSVMFDEVSKKEYPAKVIAVGGIDSDVGDVAVLEIETTDVLPVIPLSTETIDYGDRVLYVGGAVALGKQLYFGNISEPKVDIPKMEGGQGAPKGWNNTFLLSVAGGPGASGSGIISAKTGKIVGILVGHPPEGRGVAIAVRLEQLQVLLYNCQKRQTVPGGVCNIKPYTQPRLDFGPVKW